VSAVELLALRRREVASVGMRRCLSALWVGAVLAGLSVWGTAPAEAARPERFASGVPGPANLAFDSRGRLWVASGGHVPRATNGVWLVRRAGARPVQVVRGLFSALGLTWRSGRLYVAHVVRSGGGASGYVCRVTSFAGFDGRAFARSRVVLYGLPVGRHRLGSIVAGRGQRLYLGVGSRYDDRGSGERLSATVVSFRPGHRGIRVEATGLRNPYGLAFLPGTSKILISEHGRDDLGLRRPPEELNLVDVAEPAPDLGFPDCFGQGGPACRGTVRPLVRLASHAAPGAIAVAASSSTRATAFVPQFGSSLDAHPTGGDVVAIALSRRAGRWHARARRFARGLGRRNPLGAAIGPDGALYVSCGVAVALCASISEPRSRSTRRRRPPASRRSWRACWHGWRITSPAGYP
jgi:glucose/arabinose dehydrogenase